MLEIHEDPEVMKQLSLTGSTGTITTAWRNVAMMVGHWHLRGYGQWTVVEKSTGLVIGRVGLFNPEGWPGLELGWVIRRARWGQGFATEAATAALEWAWKTITEDHIISLIKPDNLASIRIAQKIGESLERNDVMNGEFVHIFGIWRSPRH